MASRDRGLDNFQFDNYQIVDVSNHDRRRPMTRDEKLVKMFRALGHPNRFKLFVEILGQPANAIAPGHSCLVHVIMDRLNIGAPTVSHHLKELVNADLISTAREGKFLTCKVNDGALSVLQSFFNTTQAKGKS
jgi:DNA-binding transcriptional ArsR family regulator